MGADRLQKGGYAPVKGFADGAAMVREPVEVEVADGVGTPSGDAEGPRGEQKHQAAEENGCSGPDRPGRWQVRIEHEDERDDDERRGNQEGDLPEYSEKPV